MAARVWPWPGRKLPPDLRPGAVAERAAGAAIETAWEEVLLERSVEIRLPDWRRRSVVHRGADALARLLTPVL